MAIIKIKNLRKVYKTHKREAGLFNAVKSLFVRHYETKHALKGISFEVQKGEIVGFIGPNGAGKSTTIKVISGVLFPTEGEVNVLGFTPWKDRVKYVENIGVVFGQKPQLVWDLPPIDSYHLNKDIYGIPEKVFNKRLNYMIKLLDIGDFIKTPARDLSLGERMKCKLVAAMLHNPKLVFLDEPTIGLDVIAKDKLRDFIKDTNKRYGTTFIITTHDMQDIERLCKRIIIINHGEIVYDGNLKHIKSKALSSKVLDVKLLESKDHFKLKGCRVLKVGKYGMKIKVDTNVTSIKKVMDYLVDNYDFADLTISDPPIEEIIKKIYEK
ncbi:MAG: ATP-binding cassette domain-containing protein [Nanoarchaeota archaeon]|nr:ATP-binding cassette domain-containing protein [Nanoarchaeota archaeon]MCG2717970.1 ATP-binding cassette domain-containing protein [Nanoarchaeota archaeon]